MGGYFFPRMDEGAEKKAIAQIKEKNTENTGKQVLEGERPEGETISGKPGGGAKMTSAISLVRISRKEKRHDGERARRFNRGAVERDGGGGEKKAFVGCKRSCANYKDTFRSIKNPELVENLWEGKKKQGANFLKFKTKKDDKV